MTHIAALIARHPLVANIVALAVLIAAWRWL
jgi:hypothetical protein